MTIPIMSELYPNYLISKWISILTAPRLTPRSNAVWASSSNKPILLSVEFISSFFKKCFINQCSFSYIRKGYSYSSTECVILFTPKKRCPDHFKRLLLIIFCIVRLMCNYIYWEVGHWITTDNTDTTLNTGLWLSPYTTNLPSASPPPFLPSTRGYFSGYPCNICLQLSCAHRSPFCPY